jgi:hypothetical protein
MQSLNRWAYLLLWLGISTAIWVLFVPSSLSLSIFAAANLTILMGVILARTVWTGSRPTRSVHQVLYEAEEPARAGQKK